MLVVLPPAARRSGARSGGKTLFSRFLFANTPGFWLLFPASLDEKTVLIAE